MVEIKKVSEGNRWDGIPDEVVADHYEKLYPEEFNQRPPVKTEKEPTDYDLRKKLAWAEFERNKSERIRDAVAAPPTTRKDKPPGALWVEAKKPRRRGNRR